MVASCATSLSPALSFFFSFTALCSCNCFFHTGMPPSPRTGLRNGRPAGDTARRPLTGEFRLTSSAFTPAGPSASFLRACCVSFAKGDFSRAACFFSCSSSAGPNSLSISSSPKSRELPLGNSSDISSTRLESDTTLSLAAGAPLVGVSTRRFTGVLRGEGAMSSFGVEVALASSFGGAGEKLVAGVPTAGFLVGLLVTPGGFRSALGEEWGDILRRLLFMAMAKPARGFARPMPKRARTCGGQIHKKGMSAHLQLQQWVPDRRAR